VFKAANPFPALVFCLFRLVEKWMNAVIDGIAGDRPIRWDGDVEDTSYHQGPLCPDSNNDLNFLLLSKIISLIAFHRIRRWKYRFQEFEFGNSFAPSAYSIFFFSVCESESCLLL